MSKSNFMHFIPRDGNVFYAMWDNENSAKRLYFIISNLKKGDYTVPPSLPNLIKKKQVSSIQYFDIPKNQNITVMFFINGMKTQTPNATFIEMKTFLSNYVIEHFPIGVSLKWHEESLESFVS